MRRRIVPLAAILAAWLVVVVRGRGGGPIPLSVAVKAATNGSFYHWSSWSADTLSLERAEGWCAQRRSRTLDYFGENPGTEERTSPSGIYRKAKGRETFEPRTDVTGMEVGHDFLSESTARLTGPDAKLTPLGGNRWQGGTAVYTLEPRTARILRIDSPSERILIDYPLALSSDVFERSL